MVKKLIQNFWVWLGGEVAEPPPKSPALYANLAGPPAPPKNPPAPRPATQPVTVQPGDTLFSLAQRHNLSVQAIVQANHLNDQSRLYVGQKLHLPIPAPAPPPPQAPAEPVAYLVHKGETLAGIAQKFALPAELISAENKIEDPDRLMAGQWLVIPSLPAAETASPEKPAAPPQPPSAKTPPPPIVYRPAPARPAPLPIARDAAKPPLPLGPALQITKKPPLPPRLHRRRKSRPRPSPSLAGHCRAFMWPIMP